MKKQEIIDTIQTVVRQWGEFTINDVPSGTSPIFVIGEAGKVNKISIDDIIAVECLDEDEEFSLPIDTLTVDILEQILVLAGEYDTLMDKTIKRCSSY